MNQRSGYKKIENRGLHPPPSKNLIFCTLNSTLYKGSSIIVGEPFSFYNLTMEGCNMAIKKTD